MADPVERLGHRGYIGSRRYNRDLPPQHIQNLVVRDYCHKNGFTYLLSVTEYGMQGCYLMLEDVLNEISALAGIVLYSIWMLPADREERQRICRRVFLAGATLHGAVERFVLEDEESLKRLDDLWDLSALSETAIAPIK